MCCIQTMLYAQQVLEYEMYLSRNKWMVVYNLLRGWIWKSVQYMATSSTVQKPVLTKWCSYLTAVVAELYTDYYNWVWYISTNTRYCSEQQLNSLNTHVKNPSPDQECTCGFNFIFAFSPSEYYSAWHLIMPSIWQVTCAFHQYCHHYQCCHNSIIIIIIINNNNNNNNKNNKVLPS